MEISTLLMPASFSYLSKNVTVRNALLASRMKLSTNGLTISTLYLPTTATISLRMVLKGGNLRSQLLLTGYRLTQAPEN
jgi:hypothetical protein